MIGTEFRCTCTDQSFCPKPIEIIREEKREKYVEGAGSEQ
jgi:hypothetical protein